MPVSGKLYTAAWLWHYESLGKIERTLFLLQYISSVELRRRIHVGLNMVAAIVVRIKF